MNTNAQKMNSIKILRSLRQRGEISDTQFRGQAKAAKRTTARSIRHSERQEIEAELAEVDYGFNSRGVTPLQILLPKGAA